MTVRGKGWILLLTWAIAVQMDLYGSEQAGAAAVPSCSTDPAVHQLINTFFESLAAEPETVLEKLKERFPLDDESRGYMTGRLRELIAQVGPYDGFEEVAVYKLGGGTRCCQFEYVRSRCIGMADSG
jgi:hypothetical protein